MSSKNNYIVESETVIYTVIHTIHSIKTGDVKSMKSACGNCNREFL